MTQSNKEGIAPAINSDLLRRLAEGLKPIDRDQVIYRRNERPPIISVLSPARARLSSHSIRLAGDCANLCGQPGRNPQALMAMDTSVSSYVLLQPVELYDPNVKHQYQLTWSEGLRRAHFDMRPILQPRNLEAPEGYVREIPVSLVQLPTGGHYLVLHIGNTTVRPVGELTPEDEQDLTAGNDTPDGSAS